jgi:hypothetical protein
MHTFFYSVKCFNIAANRQKLFEAINDINRDQHSMTIVINVIIKVITFDLTKLVMCCSSKIAYKPFHCGCRHVISKKLDFVFLKLGSFIFI